MNILEIHLINPIGFNEIDKLILKALRSVDYNYLIIDTGNHDFVSIATIKYFKEKMQKNKKDFIKFKKIAFIHPSHYRNESSTPSFYNYFTSKHEANDWFSLNT